MADQQPSVTDELRKLAELKASGSLTDDEFVKAKAALLRTLHAAAPVAPPEPVTCKSCNGSGKCHQCEGSGRVVVGRSAGFAGSSGYPIYGECPRCGGTKNCQTCNGRGTV